MTTLSGWNTEVHTSEELTQMMISATLVLGLIRATVHTRWRHELFRNRSFMLDEMFQRKDSTFAILLEYENPHRF